MAEKNELVKTLWAAVDQLRSNMDAAEYKYIYGKHIRILDLLQKSE